MKLVNSVSRIVGYASIIVVIMMMLLTVSDVFMRYTFSNPITGTTELTEYMMVCLMLAMAWAAVEGKHVSVDIVMKFLPKRFQAVVDSINFLICLGLYVIIVRQSYVAGLFSRKYNVESTLLDIPEFPFFLVLVLGFAILCAAIVPLLIKKIQEAKK